MISAGVHLTVQNAAPKKKQCNFLASFIQIGECKKENNLNVVPKKNKVLQLVIIVIYSQNDDPYQKDKVSQ